MRRFRPPAVAAVAGQALLLAIPAAASASGSSVAASECQQSGYVNYATTTGTKFGNTGQCVSYAAQGGTLVPLPDLVPTVSCTTASSSVGCTFGVKNIGIGPAVGVLDVEATLTITATDLSALTNVYTEADALAGCGAPTVATTMTDVQTTMNPTGQAAAEAKCTTTLAPGATASLLSVGVGGGQLGSAGTAVVNAAVNLPTRSSKATATTTATARPTPSPARRPLQPAKRMPWSRSLRRDRG